MHDAARVAAKLERYEDPGRFAADFQAGSGFVTPTGRDAFRAELALARIDDLLLCQGRMSPALALVQAPADSVVLQLIRGGDALVLNGRQAPRHGFGGYLGGAALARRNAAPFQFGVIALPAAQAEHVPGLRALLRRPEPGRQAVSEATPGQIQPVMRLLEQAAAIARLHPDDLAGSAARESLREDLFECIRTMLEDLDATPVSHVRATRSRCRIVFGAEDYQRANIGRPIYTEEVCQALGVSPVTLGVAFRSMLGMTPHRYFKLRRLHMVRAALLDHENPPPRVKTAALSHGFWHPGYFSRDYYEVFGESPSATLMRSRGAPAEAALAEATA